MATKSLKRKRVVLTMKAKLAILDKMANGCTQRSLAEEYGVGKATVCDLKKNEAKIKDFASSLEDQGMSSSRKIMRLAKDEQVEAALYLWFTQKRGQDTPISGPLLKEKALEFHNMLHEGEADPPSFNASAGWLWRFCKRHGIHQLSLQGEQLSSNESATATFKKRLQEIMEKESLTLEQVYNCDETGLCYKMLPTKTLAARAEKGAKGMKKQKDRVTIMACSNASGSHKLPLVLIHKSLNPRCFKNLNKSALPVKYYSQRNAWMDSDIFKKWFEAEFVPAVTKHLKDKGLEPKALLLMDNAPSHPSGTVLVSKDKKITMMFLPANTTALIQPMDQGVLEAMKRRYRKSLLRKLLMVDGEGQSMVTFVKTINIKHVVYMVADAWEDIPSSTLCKSWYKLLATVPSPGSLPEGSDQSSEDGSQPGETCAQLMQQLDGTLTSEEIAQWMSVDSEDPGYQLATDEEIVQQVSQTAQPESSDEEDDEDVSTESSITSSQAADMLGECLKWYEKQEEATPTSLMVLKGVRDLACKKRFHNLKQRTLGSTFSTH